MASPPQRPTARLPGQDFPLRQMLVLRRTETLVNNYSEMNADRLVDYIRKNLDGYQGPLRIASLPSSYWLRARPELARRVVISLGFADEAEVDEFRRGFDSRGPGTDLLAVGCDLLIEASDYFCSFGSGQNGFSTRSDAHHLVGVDLLPAPSNRRVNVVIVDRGVDQTLIGPRYAGGWPHPNGTPLPGSATLGHGAMTTRNVLAVAPTAYIWDLPLIPSRITDPPTFLSDAFAGYLAALLDIAMNSASRRYSGSWVFVNPWALFDRRGEWPLGDYTNNPSHPFNVLISAAVWRRRDVVFSAGNCGLFCPDWRCGQTDRGPGQSILGASSHHKVLTVGAIRNDQIWLGYSSQGPSQPGFNALGLNQKPDLCAPTDFSEDNDHAVLNSGTSAACAVVAGLIARLRTRHSWAAANLPPAQMRAALTASAVPIPGTVTANEVGHGRIDAMGAYNNLLANFP